MKLTNAIGLTLICAGIYSDTCMGQSVFFRTYGGLSNDLARAVQQTSDGGFIVAGETYSFGEGSRDVFLFKTDTAGGQVWAKTYGGTSEDYAYALDQTANNGFIVGSHTASFGQGGHDFHFLETDANGDTLLTKTYGGPAPDGIYSMQTNSDGAFILGGHTSSFGPGQHDFYLVKIDQFGDTLWTRSYGSTQGDYLRSIELLEADFTYYIATGETAGFGVGGTDILAINVGGFSGDTIWARTFGGSGSDYANGIKGTIDGGLILAGNTTSSGAGGADILLVKLDFFGNLIWAKTYGGPGQEFGNAIETMPDGGFVIVGSTTSFGDGLKDVYMIRTDASGDTLWTSTYGSTGNDDALSVAQTTDGGIVLTGFTDGFGQQNQALLIKTDGLGNTSCNASTTSTIVGVANLSTTVPDLQMAHGTIVDNTATIQNLAASTSNSCPLVGIDKLAEVLIDVVVYPNPTSGNSQIRFTLKHESKVEITVRNIHGQLVNSFSEGMKNIGKHSRELDMNGLSQGIYYLSLRTDEAETTIKLMMTE